jgi:phosphodiesterase/alkaline phosphatase D-like protein
VRRLAVVVLAIAACIPVRLATSATRSVPAFDYGVAAGEITSTSAVLWTRAPARGPVVLGLWEASRCRRPAGGDLFRCPGGREVVRPALPGNDLTVTIRVAGWLRPGHRYRYQFRHGRSRSEIGAFVSAPAREADARVRFAFSGDADATPGPDGKPGFNRFQVYGRMAAEMNDFDVNLGDTIYSDSELAGSKPALTVAEKWQKYRYGLALPALRRLRAATGLYSQWDDHEFLNDFSRAKGGEALYRAGRKAFIDYTPVSYSAAEGLYRTFRWGSNVELFFLDERSFRSAEASAGGVCDVAGAPDLAPTAPAAVRAAFGTVLPPLAQPVPRACLDAIESPARSLLGERQHASFVKAIRASTATWKVVLNETPIQQLYQLPYDRWEGYAAERSQLLHDLAGLRNVVFLTTDTHANLIGEVRLQTLEASGPVGTGIWEVVTGPVATNTYAREVDAAVGRRGTGDFVTSLFFKPRPPRGLGLLCAATDVDSYAEVDVTRATLTVTPKTASGSPVYEQTGGRCGPLVLHAA